MFCHTPVISYHVTSISSRSGGLPREYIHILMLTSDNGPDQVGTRNSLHAHFAAHDDQFAWMLFFPVHCLKHSYHLAAQSSLRLCDELLLRMGKKFKYFTSIATMSHTWRSHLVKVQSVWWRQHQESMSENKKKALFSMPPLAISGRWASVDGCLSLVCSHFYYLLCMMS